MALRFFDSFDHYATGDIAEKWTSAVGMSVVAGVGRRGTAAIGHTGGAAHLRITLDPQPTWIMGAAIKRPAILSGGYLLWLGDVSSEQCGLYLNLDGSVSFRSGTTTLGTSIASIPEGIYTYVQLKVTIHDTLGSYEVRFNKDTVLSATGVKTQNTANASANVVCLVSRLSTNDAPAYSNIAACYDDFYVCDGVGDMNNDFLGDVRVDSALPIGPGAAAQFTPSAGSNYQCVNEGQPNNDTSFVMSKTPGHIDTYGFADIVHEPSGILGVQVLANAKKDDAGERSIATQTLSGGTNFSGATQSLGTEYKYHRAILEVDPATAQPWTKEGVNSAEHGVKVAA